MRGFVDGLGRWTGWPIQLAEPASAASTPRSNGKPPALLTISKLSNYEESAAVGVVRADNIAAVVGASIVDLVDDFDMLFSLLPLLRLLLPSLCLRRHAIDNGNNNSSSGTDSRSRRTGTRWRATNGGLSLWYGDYCSHSTVSYCQWRHSWASADTHSIGSFHGTLGQLPHCFYNCSCVVRCCCVLLPQLQERANLYWSRATHRLAALLRTEGDLLQW
ncbi:hypothetical protein BIW11_04479 [Tropilaelaps mercedesae]|uniref:Uncharacterized protein n=1 Tax=Tropilaelaps mercedesae TaxID=418985 RepID=A0A1V9X5V1_9ACAR|nr:hypothetical protein BIW11_04479 [Tropilaelaps mercedesae]